MALSDFLNGHNFSLFTMLFMLTLGNPKNAALHKKLLRHQKLLCESQKNVLWQQKKLCDTQKKTHVD